MSRADQFVEKYMPYALQMEQNFGVPAVVAMAQSALETGWGKHAPGNMMFGMKTGKSWKGKKQLLTTTEYHNNDQVKYPKILSITKVSGRRFKYRVKDWFRKYNSPYDSFVDYAKLLKRSTRYAKAFNFKDDPYRFAQEIARAGYATAPDYYYRIRVIMDMIKKKALESGHSPGISGRGNNSDNLKKQAMEKKYDVNYKIELHTVNDSVKPDGFNSIEFIRKGDEDITVAQAIELDADTPSFEFVNRPMEVIKNNFDFKFAGGGADPKLIVIKTYYERII